MKRLLDEHAGTMMADAYTACRGADAVVSSFTSDLFAVSIAEKTGAQHFSTPLQPAMVATRSGSAIPQAPLPSRTSLLNYLFGRWIMEPAVWRLMRAAHDRFRSNIGLPPQTYDQHRAGFGRMTIVQGFSDRVVPPPPDWPPNIHVAGYWFLDEDDGWPPPPDLQAFLDAGEPPVFIGFGSMTASDSRALTEIILQAVALSGRRAVIQSGWAGMGNVQLPPSVFLLDAAPHHRLFPLMDAVVHHGGRPARRSPDRRRAAPG